MVLTSEVSDMLKYWMGFAIFLVAINLFVMGYVDENIGFRIAGAGMLGTWYAIAFLGRD